MVIAYFECPIFSQLAHPSFNPIAVKCVEDVHNISVECCLGADQTGSFGGVIVITMACQLVLNLQSVPVVAHSSEFPDGTHLELFTSDVFGPSMPQPQPQPIPAPRGSWITSSARCEFGIEDIEAEIDGRTGSERRCRPDHTL